jgi:hypothetical protein
MDSHWLRVSESPTNLHSIVQQQQQLQFFLLVGALRVLERGNNL